MNKVNDIIQAAVCKYGANSQIDISIEEMAELTKELIKNKRGLNNIESIAEEIADVQIMLDQLKIIYGIDCLAMTYRAEKLRRLKDRIINE